MLENYLIQIGMRCGTIKNFNSSILEDARLKDFSHWYFLTPIKSTVKIGNLKEAVLSLAFPFDFEKGDDSEAIVIERLSTDTLDLQAELISELRKRIIVSQFSFTPIPFWANEKGSERMMLKDFGNNRIHILSGTLTVQYRDRWITPAT